MGVPEPWDIDIYRGDDYTLSIPVVNEATPPAPFPLTGLTFSAQLRLTHDSDEAIPFTVEVDLTTSAITLSLTETQTAALTGRRYVWDLQTTRTADNYVETWLAGRVTVGKDVTRG